MITVLASVIVAVAVIGAWLRWATIPVLLAYELGKVVERVTS